MKCTILVVACNHILWDPVCPHLAVGISDRNPIAMWSCMVDEATQEEEPEANITVERPEQFIPYTNL